jgi:hypothetical protein
MRNVDVLVLNAEVNTASEQLRSLVFYITFIVCVNTP